ncbi:hypothetical protein [Nitrosomonas sp.]|uniref:hypothetical protein n=1 Tax=Nitrosomonas sp. TaxID=42353 RepID=UPI001D30AFD1|nr:hypothetical protein [Nitrosomonas sp.]MCB1947562.1 hypothetical protein [Nitrosomonas sp.]MCP5243371.1 hypothetical protein [Burkholderiales bacterium]MDR4514813.1 hypothetical protein [Nitrosomonas sp.]
MTKERSHIQTDTAYQVDKAPLKVSQKHKRRKLLKGAVAVPVVMTLYSGAALARTSNITGEADSIENAVFKDTSNGPQLLCVFPDPMQTQIPGGPYDLGPLPQATLIQTPPIDLTASAETILTSKMQQLEECHARGGIMISAVAYTSIMSKTGININPTW